MATNEQELIDLKQEALRRIIGDFSERFLENLDDQIKLIQLIYTDDFRHTYSNITATLIHLNKNNPNALEYISYNFASLVDQFPKNDFPEAYKSLTKLHDHIILEQIRLKEVYADSQELANDARDLSNKATIALKKADTLVEETNAVKKEVITVLGIFSAIILAFIGGLTFSTSVFSNLHSASIYRIVLSILLIGLILINILYGLFYYIDRLVRKASEDKIKPLIFTNIIILLLIVFTIIAWGTGIVEKRNEKLASSIYTELQITEPISKNDKPPTKEN